MLFVLSSSSFIYRMKKIYRMPMLKVFGVQILSKVFKRPYQYIRHVVAERLYSLMRVKCMVSTKKNITDDTKCQWLVEKNQRDYINEIRLIKVTLKRNLKLQKIIVGAAGVNERRNECNQRIWLICPRICVILV